MSFFIMPVAGTKIEIEKKHITNKNNNNKIKQISRTNEKNQIKQ